MDKKYYVIIDGYSLLTQYYESRKVMKKQINELASRYGGSIRVLIDEEKRYYIVFKDYYDKVDTTIECFLAE